MYFDLSIVPNNTIELRHLLSRLQQESIDTVALDFQFKNLITEPTYKQLDIIKIAKQSKTKVYSRSTLLVEQSITLHQLNQTQKGYDILAVKPTNEKMFHALCTEYDNYDIICFDMAVKMPFMLKRNPVYQALRKGKYFQLQYDPIFDDHTRVVCMTNIINIIKATKGKNIIISSHASNMYRHRTPYDVASLLISLGMNKNQTLACMKQNAENVVKSAIHRAYFKGSIRQVSAPEVKKMSKKIKKHQINIRKIIAKNQQKIQNEQKATQKNKICEQIRQN